MTKNEVVSLDAVVMEMEPIFNDVRADKQMTFAREAEFALQLLYDPTKDYLKKVAFKNPQSLKDSIVNVGAIGLSLNPAMKMAYLVPRDDKVCLDISYMGLVHLATDSGAIRWVKSELVREKDEFYLQGVDQPPLHKFAPFSTARGPIVGVYCVAKTREGDYLTETMTIAEAFGIRDRSSAWKKNKSGPWKTDEGEMIRKTVVKRASKMWPKSERLDRAVDYLNTTAGEGIPFADHHAPIDVTATEVPGAPVKPTFDMDEWLMKLGTAATSDEVAEIKAAGYALLAEVQDAEAYKRFRKEANNRGRELLAQEEEKGKERQPGEEG